MKNLITRYANLDTWIYCCTHIVFMENILIRSLLNNCFLWKATMVTIKIEILSDDTNGFNHPMINFSLWKFFAKLWIAPDHRTLHIYTAISLPVRFCFIPTPLGWRCAIILRSRWKGMVWTSREKLHRFSRMIRIVPLKRRRLFSIHRSIRQGIMTKGCQT